MAVSSQLIALIGSIALVGTVVMWSMAPSSLQTYTTTASTVVPQVITTSVSMPITTAMSDSALFSAPQQTETMQEVRSTGVTAAVSPLSLTSFSVIALGLLGMAAYATGVSRKSSASLPLLPLVDKHIAMAASTGEIARRQALAVAGASMLVGNAALAAEEDVLCDAECEAKLPDIPRVKTPSGLEYQDIIVGTGPSPRVGLQVAINLVAMLPNGKVFSNTLKDGFPLEIRVGAGTVVKGLDEGVMTMKVGGIRRLYVPPELSFQQSRRAAPGTPAIPAKTPVVFDVQLQFVPGLEAEEADEGNAFEGLF